NLPGHGAPGPGGMPPAPCGSLCRALRDGSYGIVSFKVYDYGAAHHEEDRTRRGRKIMLKKNGELTQSHTVTLTDNATGVAHEFPVYRGTTGPSVVDVRSLYAKTGYFTFDPGFTSTGSCQSQITFIDGDEGILMHRGYRIE